MRSFEQPISWWETLAVRHERALALIEQARIEFSNADGQVTRAAHDIADAGVLSERHQRELCSSGGRVPYSPVEAMSFYQRRHVDGEAEQYRRVVERIHLDHAAMTWSLDNVVNLHRSMLPPEYAHAGVWRTHQFTEGLPQVHADGRLKRRATTASPADVPHFMKGMFELLDKHWQGGAIPRPLLIAAFVLDFFQIHPFLDGNGRTARLAMLWLFYRSGHSVFRYTSLEAIISRRRFAYLQALHQSYVEWHEGRHDLTDWAGFVLELLHAGYDDARQNVQRIERAAEQLRSCSDGITRMPVEFKRGELLQRAPAIEPAWADFVLARRLELGQLAVLNVNGEPTWQKRSVDNP